METNKIEQALLDRELKVITEKLEKIGSEVKDVFSKYGLIKGRHAEELQKYIVSNVLRTEELYYAGYTTEPNAIIHKDHIPECLKKLVLDWAVKEFFEDYDRISDVVGCIG